ncbi:hypothetical protein GOP47_0016983 [Adiantum capillus-veneris]|uniref:Uncharacterized protein n=1 Tax=Adiantum capillus-veneris TaxID=13818 RepID=A0A9D4UIP7_ADICA|nr:hypothetical protein GOP47_0016983 [Adiantum capillus-veneris]
MRTLCSAFLSSAKSSCVLVLIDLLHAQTKHLVTHKHPTAGPYITSSSRRNQSVAVRGIFSCTCRIISIIIVIMHFGKLDDSPMFRKQLHASEESADALKDRCLRFYKGCRKYTEELGEAYDGDIAFASALESFGGGHDDPISVAVGGPVMTKFTIALREIGTYKEILRSQVEHMLSDRLIQFASIDLQDIKEVRRRFDKASLHYDQAREKFLSLKKGTRVDVVSEVEEDLRNARSTFEQARFNLVTALSNIEAKKKFEFLESVSGTMDAHLRYFKQGYELLLQMEPYIHQVLTYAHQSRERATYEQAALAERMQEFRRQMEDNNQRSFSDVEASPSGDGIHTIGRSSHKMIEAVMQSTPRGKVQTIKQGYLLKRSSSLRGDWKRRFFVLDSRGMLYYYRKHWGKPTGHNKGHGRSHGSDNTTGLLSRFLSSHQGSPQNEKTVAHHTVNLLTSTIKLDAEQTDLRFCFRIISPSKNYALQAENAMERMDWIDKITGVIASLLNSQASYSHRLPHSPLRSSHQRTGSESSSLSSSSEFDPTMSEDSGASRLLFSNGRDSGANRSLGNSAEQQERPIDVLRQVPGNDVCADCNSPEPDWASLNLGVLLCIECSGVHRNLGVHISKVRSLTLDVKVWEPSVINVFQSLGNQFCNSVWEERISNEDSPARLSNVDSMLRFDSGHRSGELSSLLKKPDTRDSLLCKERYIYSKYAEKKYILRADLEADPASDACRIWDAVQARNKQLVYRLLVCHDADVNTLYEQAMEGSRVMLPEPNSNDHILNHATQVQENFSSRIEGSNLTVGETLQMSRNGTSSGSSESTSDDFELQGSTLLYLACRNGDLGMVELLLQYGAQVNVVNGWGKTPLQQCIAYGQSACAKLLLSRGAHSELADRGIRMPFQTALDHETGSEASGLSQQLL